jgi:hypothetical protein
VPLETLVNDAAPAYPASLLNTKNELLRVTVRGAGRDEVTFALGELDPGFGDHPALLALTQDGQPIPRGPELVVPGDRAPVGSVPPAFEVTVGIATARRPVRRRRPAARWRSLTAGTWSRSAPPSWPGRRQRRRHYLPSPPPVIRGMPVKLVAAAQISRGELESARGGAHLAAAGLLT